MAQQPNNKPFQQYQGQQVNEIPAGFIEAMGAMGQAYASIGQNIAQGMQMYKKRADEADVAKERANPIIYKTVTEVNNLKAGGIFEEGEDGNLRIAEGKETMLDPAKMGEVFKSLDLYNRTKGGTRELSASEYVGLAERVKAEAEAAKADREERLIVAKEGQVIADREAARAKEESERRKTQLDAWKEVTKAIGDTESRHSLERQQEMLTGPVNQQNEERRRGEMASLRDMQVLYKPDFGKNPTNLSSNYYNQGNGFNTGEVVPASYLPGQSRERPEAPGTSWADSKVPDISNQDGVTLPDAARYQQQGTESQGGAARTRPNALTNRAAFSSAAAVAPDLSRYATKSSALAPGLETSQKPQATEPAAPAQEAAPAATAAPAAPAAPPIKPIDIPASGVEAPEGQVARNKGNAVYRSSTSNKLNYTGAYDVLTTSRGDIRRVSISTEDDFLTVGMKKTDPFAITVDESGHPTVIMNGRMDSVDAKNATDMAGMALRFLAENRVASFGITDAQRSAVEGLPLPDGSTGIDPMLWRRALVASGIAIGRIQPAAGQNINQLTYGDMFKIPQFRSIGQIAAGEERAVSSSFNVNTRKVPTSTPLTNRTGASLEMTTSGSVGGVQFVSVLRSAAPRKRFADAGIPITADMERTFDSMDAQDKFANDLVAAQSLSAKREFEAQQARAGAGASISTKVSLNTNIARNFGELSKRYPGANQPTGEQFGHFNVPLPFKGPTSQYTSFDLTRVIEDFNSPDPEIAEKAGKDLTLMTARLSSGGVSEVQINKAAEATQLFNEAIGAISELSYANKRISEMNIIDDIATRIGIGPIQKELKAAEIRGMFLRGAIRPIIAGSGNPAVYEQLMIEATIPNLQSLTSIRSWDRARIQALALVTASGYIERMRANGFTEVTQEAIDNINLKLEAAYGDKAPKFKAEDFSGANSWMSVQTSPKRRDEWLKKRGIPTVDELNMSNEAKKWSYDGKGSIIRNKETK